MLLTGDRVARYGKLVDAATEPERLEAYLATLEVGRAWTPNHALIMHKNLNYITISMFTEPERLEAYLATLEVTRLSSEITTAI